MISFDEWVTLLFDHDSKDRARSWWDDRPRELEIIEPRTTAEYSIRLFENTPTVLARFDDDQIGNTLWLFADDLAQEVIHGNVEHQTEIRFINSIYQLFKDVFAPRCRHCITNGNFFARRGASKSLSSTCYMWWDIFPS